jgi:hypothetical protein
MLAAHCLEVPGRERIKTLNIPTEKQDLIRRMETLWGLIQSAGFALLPKDIQDRITLQYKEYKQEYTKLYKIKGD